MGEKGTEAGIKALASRWMAGCGWHSGAPYHPDEWTKGAKDAVWDPEKLQYIDPGTGRPVSPNPNEWIMK